MIINRIYGKGGGGLLPQIVASAPNGSTVTCDGNPPKAIEVGSPNSNYIFDVAIPTQLNPAWRGLPSGYKQVEYIEANGTQYLDTGVTAITGTETVNLKLEFVTKATSDYDRYFGSFDGAYRSFSGQFSGNYLGFGQGKNDIFPSALPQWSSSNKLFDMNITAGNGSYSYIVNGTTVTGTYTSSKNTTVPLMIFAMNYSSMTTKWIYQGTIRCYGCSIVRNNVKVLDLVPCYNGTVYGMYDLVSGTFIGNAGTGNFTAGSETPKYLDGTHIIVGTLNGQTNTQTVVVSAIEQYAITITYGRLPSGYTELQSISGNGAYTDTAITISSTYTYFFDFQPTAGDTALMAVNGESNYNFTLQYSNNASTATPKYTGYGWELVFCRYYYPARFSTDTTSRYKLTINNRTLVLNDTTTFSLAGQAWTNASAYLRYGIWGSSATFYEFWCKDSSNNMLHDYVPALNTNTSKVGFYDLVTNTFISSVSGTEFVAGSPV